MTNSIPPRIVELIRVRIEYHNRLSNDWANLLRQLSTPRATHHGYSVQNEAGAAELDAD
jgi:hypothetical protein